MQQWSNPETGGKVTVLASPFPSSCPSGGHQHLPVWTPAWPTRGRGARRRVPGGTRPTSRPLGQLQKRPQAWRPPCSCLMGPGHASPWPGQGHRGPLLPIVPPGPHFQVPGATLQEPRVGWRAKSQVVCDAKAWGPGGVQSIQAAPRVVYARPFFGPGRGCPYVLGAPRLWTQEGRQLASRKKCRPRRPARVGLGRRLVWGRGV